MRKSARGPGPAVWPEFAGFDEAYGATLDYLKALPEHGINLRLSRPVLFQAYCVQESWPDIGQQGVSRFLRFGKTSMSAAGGGRDAKAAVAQMLSVAVKAHFFMFPNAVVGREPQVIGVPDLSRPGSYSWMLIYPLLPPEGEAGQRPSTIVVGQFDAQFAASVFPRLSRAEEFPVALSKDPFRWLRRKDWERQKQDAVRGSEEYGMSAWFDPAGLSRRRYDLLRKIDAHTDLPSFPYGEVLDYGKGMRYEMRQVGAAWAKGIRRWYLPHGFDVQAVKEYLDAMAEMAEDERLRHSWLRPVDGLYGYAGKPKPLKVDGG